MKDLIFKPFTMFHPRDRDFQSAALIFQSAALILLSAALDFRSKALVFRSKALFFQSAGLLFVGPTCSSAGNFLRKR